MKTCKYCGVDSPDIDFVCRGKMGHKCVSCRKEHQKGKDAERRIVKYVEIREEKKEYRNRLRKQVLDGYGAKCARCGFDDVRALALDHVNDNGAEERRESHRVQVWVKIIKTGFPVDYQVLCANCNAIKEFERRQK